MTSQFADTTWSPNFARMFLMKFYWMLQNARVTDFTISELLRENQKFISPAPPAIQIRVNAPGNNYKQIKNQIIKKIVI